MGRSNWSTSEIELAVQSALVESGYWHRSSADGGFSITTLFADLFYAGEGVVEISHIPRSEATFAQISAYRAALEAHSVSKHLWVKVVPFGVSATEYRLWIGYGMRLWPNEG
jgi:hypothetical protein